VALDSPQPLRSNALKLKTSLNGRWRPARDTNLPAGDASAEHA
jgi:hypothetical protein